MNVLKRFTVFCLVALTVSIAAWGNAGIYAQEREAHLNELQECESELQAMQQTILTAQEKAVLLER